VEGLGNIATSHSRAGSSARYKMAGLSYWAASQNVFPTMTGTQQLIQIECGTEFRNRAEQHPCIAPLN
jgi:hypothetical protein